MNEILLPSIALALMAAGIVMLSLQHPWRRGSEPVAGYFSWLPGAVLFLLAGCVVFFWGWHGADDFGAKPHDSTAQNKPVQIHAEFPWGEDSPSAQPVTGSLGRQTAQDESAADAPAADALAAGRVTPPPANESAVLQTGQTQSTGQPPPSSALVISGGSARAGSFEKIAPELYPPRSLTSLKWRDAALHNNGGAVLLMDGTLAFWDVFAPGKEHRFTLPHPADALAATPTEVVARAKDGTVWLLPRQAGEGPVPLALEGISRIHSSAQPGRMLAAFTPYSYNGAADFVILPLSGGENPVPLPKSGAFKTVDDATLAPDGNVWALSSAGHTCLWRPGSQAIVPVAETRFSSLAVFGPHVVVVESGTGRLRLLHGSAKTPSVTGMARVIGVFGMALAWGKDGKAVLWGSKVSGSPRHFQLPDDHFEVRLGPTGLFVSW